MRLRYFSALTLVWLMFILIVSSASAQLPGGDLNPVSVPKYVSPLVKPPEMPRDGIIRTKDGKIADYYKIAVRQFQQQILPAGYPMTTVWGYGPERDPRTVAQGGSYHYPAFTIGAWYNVPTAVKWVNGLVDANGNYLPHLLPVDQTLHWANPPGPRDHHGMSQDPYTGPVPIVTHVHGAHVSEESDGYPEAWFLPAAKNIPSSIQYRTGTFYDYFKSKYNLNWAPGSATFTYPNNQRATTLWYHDHSLGMTRLNVYAGPAGFYLIRGGPDSVVLDSRFQKKCVPAILPGPAPGKGSNPLGTYYEIPIAIQDRSFNADGSLFYPDNRAFFEGLDPSQLQIPFHPDPGCDGMHSDVPPIWQPEFFGNFMVVNGQTWPYLNVEQRRYRFRLLNGCNSRFLILDFTSIPGVHVWQIGAEGGFLAAPVNINAVNNGQLLMGPAERADVIVDFTGVARGSYTLLNVGPDGPFGGGIPGIDFPFADLNTTGQVMEFRVGPRKCVDLTTPPQYLKLPAIKALTPTNTRRVSLNEQMSMNVFVTEQDGSIVYDCGSDMAFGPVAALLGTYDATSGLPSPLRWMDDMTETPDVGDTETWEIYNFTADAHPIHLHLVQFQVVNRQALSPLDEEGIAQPPAFPAGVARSAEAWESGWKDTVIAYPGEVTRIKARFDYAGLYVWHCHIVEHEDNEMMRPYHVGPIPADFPIQ